MYMRDFGNWHHKKFFPNKGFFRAPFAKKCDMIFRGSVTLTPRKEKSHGSCQEAGLEEDHQERREDQGQEGQVSLRHGQSQRI
jgi:hypothetical protein